MGALLSRPAAANALTSSLSTDDNTPPVTAIVARKPVSKSKAAARSIHATTDDGPQFRVLECPPEIRNRIYTFAFLAKAEPRAFSSDVFDRSGRFKTQVRDLASFSLPALTQVSRQLRAESLPIFFSVCKFDVFVDSNFTDRARARIGLPPDTSVNQRKHSGVLSMKKNLKRRLYTFKSTALFRNVTFNVRATGSWPRSCRPISSRVMCVHVQFAGQAGVQVRSCDGPDMLKTPYAMSAYSREDVDATVKEMENVAESMGKRADFKGFTVRDLELLANAFRFTGK